MFSNIDEKDDVNSENRKTKSNIKKSKTVKIGCADGGVKENKQFVPI